MKSHQFPEIPSAAEVSEIVRIFKALADPTRARLIMALTDGERSVSALVAGLELPQSSVSRHLASLRAAGLAETRRDGTQIYYRLADAHIGELLLQAFAHTEHERHHLPQHE